MKLTFKWDEGKARENFKKYKVSFDEGKAINKIMQKIKTEEPTNVEEMRPEYNFFYYEAKVRGKHFKAYHEGHKVLYQFRETKPVNPPKYLII